MKRKLIKQGTGALTITLPKEWVSKYELKSGDEVEVDEQEKNLILKTNDNACSLRKKTINVDNLNQRLIWRSFTAAYRVGYDEINIKFLDIDKIYNISFSSLGNFEKDWKMGIIEIIQDVTSRCIGMEIVDQKNNLCVVKDLGEASEKKFDDALRRIFLLLLSIGENSLLGIKKKVKSLEPSINAIDTNIDKFTDFCLRILNKRGYREVKKMNTLYSLILLLEFIGDEYKRISFHISESKMNKIDSRLIEIYYKINKQVNLFYELFYKFEEEKTLEIYELDIELVKNMAVLAPKLNDEEREILHHLKKIRRGIVDLLQLRIDFEV